MTAAVIGALRVKKSLHWQVQETSSETVQYYSYRKEADEIDESDIHEEKFVLRFLATNTQNQNRYLWITDDGEVRTDGYYGYLACNFIAVCKCQKVSEYDQEIPQSHTADQPMALTVTRHQEDN